MTDRYAPVAHLDLANPTFTHDEQEEEEEDDDDTNNNHYHHNDDESVLEDLLNDLDEMKPKRTTKRSSKASYHFPSSNTMHHNKHISKGYLEINTAGGMLDAPPLLSPNEELHLLAVKGKRASPDRDNDDGLPNNAPRHASTTPVHHHRPTNASTTKTFQRISTEPPLQKNTTQPSLSSNNSSEEETKLAIAAGLEYLSKEQESQSASRAAAASSSSRTKSDNDDVVPSSSSARTSSSIPRRRKEKFLSKVKSRLMSKALKPGAVAVTRDLENKRKTAVTRDLENKQQQQQQQGDTATNDVENSRSIRNAATATATATPGGVTVLGPAASSYDSEKDDDNNNNDDDNDDDGPSYIMDDHTPQQQQQQQQQSRFHHNQDETAVDQSASAKLLCTMPIPGLYSVFSEGAPTLIDEEDDDDENDPPAMIHKNSCCTPTTAAAAAAASTKKTREQVTVEIPTQDNYFIAKSSPWSVSAAVRSSAAAAAAAATVVASSSAAGRPPISTKSNTTTKSNSRRPGAVPVDGRRERTKFENLHTGRESSSPGERFAGGQQPQETTKLQSAQSTESNNSNNNSNNNRRSRGRQERTKFENLHTGRESSSPKIGTIYGSGMDKYSTKADGRDGRLQLAPPLYSFSLPSTMSDTEATIPHLSSSVTYPEDDTIIPLPDSQPTSDRPGIKHAISAELVTEEPYYEEEELQRLQREAEQQAEADLFGTAISVKPIIVKEEGVNWKLFAVVAFFLVVAAVVAVAVVLTRTPEDTGSKYNDICKHAFPDFELFPGDNIQGLIDERAGTEEAVCQVAMNEGGNGLWYSVSGKGSRLIASTCNDPDPSDNSIARVMVFEGSCDTLLCVGGADRLCGEHGAAVEWMAEEGKLYYILVDGWRKTYTGPFNLTIDAIDDNNSCSSAAGIEVLGGKVFGSTRDFFLDDSLDVQCGGPMVAPGGWFRLDGDGNVACASVDSGNEQVLPDFPVQLSIYSGESCEETTCVDRASGTKEIAWLAEVGTSYFFFIHGEKANSEGDFILNLRVAPNNGICETAQKVKIGENQTVGSLVNACQTKAIECPGIMNNPGVWYIVKGTGEVLMAMVQGLFCESSQVRVFGGDDCSRLECLGIIQEPCTPNARQTKVQWISNAEEFYYILVQSSDPREFILTVHELILGATDKCEDATLLKASGDIILDSTATATADTLGICAIPSSPGVFYRVVGTGDWLSASTCNSETKFSTEITILSGSCGRFDCIDSTAVSCDGIRSAVFWPSALGQTYYIHVHGAESADSNAGRFGLQIDQGKLLVENDFCGMAEELLVPSIIYGSTADARLDDVGACVTGDGTFEITAPGVWYKVKGTGRSLEASLCEGTDYDTQLYVFTGTCADLKCIQTNDDSCSYQSKVTWNALDGEEYFILVSGAFRNAVGPFELRLSEI